MKKHEFMNDPQAAAKKILGLTKSSSRTKALICFVSQSVIPMDAEIKTVTSSDWNYFRRMPNFPKSREIRSSSCYDWEVIGAENFGRPYVFAYAE